VYGDDAVGRPRSQTDRVRKKRAIQRIAPTKTY
jgi:hypothetical protein